MSSPTAPADPAPLSPERPTPDDALGEAALRAVLTPQARAALEKKAAGLVVISTPGEAWNEAMNQAFSVRLPWVDVTQVNRAPGRGVSPMKATSVKRPAVVLTADASWLPAPILGACDFELSFVLSPRVVVSAVRAITGERLRLNGLNLVGLEFDDLILALRPGASAAECLVRLRRASDRRALQGQPAAARPLDELGGFGPALDAVKAIAREAHDARATGRPVPSLLIFGPPGTGKTMLAGSLARSVGVPLIRTTVADWFVSEGHLGAVTTLADRFFRSAEALGNCVAFMDELDALPNRAAMDDDHRSWWTPLLTGVLTMIDRTRRSAPGVLLVAATNHYDRLDDALKRPGRFDRHVEILGPGSRDEIADVFRFHLGADAACVDLEPVTEVAALRGMSGAAIEAAVRAAREAARVEARALHGQDLLQAVAPQERENPERLRSTALHEAAHAIVACAVGLRVIHVSIIGSGRVLGVTTYDDDGVAMTRRFIEGNVAATLAGRAADDLFSGSPAAGAASDLRHATRLIAAMHGCFGLGDTLVTRGEFDEAEKLLAFDPILTRQVDADLVRLMAVSRGLLQRHEGAVRRLADLLVSRRVVSGAAVEAIWQEELSADKSPTSRRRPPAKRSPNDQGKA